MDKPTIKKKIPALVHVHGLTRKKKETGINHNRTDAETGRAVSWRSLEEFILIYSFKTKLLLVIVTMTTWDF